MRGDCAAAQAFVFAQGNPLEALDQAQPDAIDNVLGQPGKQPRLQHIEHQRPDPQHQRQQENQANVTHSFLQAVRQQMVHDVQGSVAAPQQHLVDQQR
ncbi:hypothetical protein ALP75_205360 [Pseudomonas syringae pv. actinidiae]|nr:hypothetical protein ALP75_205360 [Pseudomonas syringae pv. actinidiae]